MSTSTVRNIVRRYPRIVVLVRVRIPVLQGKSGRMNRTPKNSGLRCAETLVLRGSAGDTRRVNAASAVIHEYGKVDERRKRLCCLPRCQPHCEYQLRTGLVAACWAAIHGATQLEGKFGVLWRPHASTTVTPGGFDRLRRECLHTREHTEAGFLAQGSIPAEGRSREEAHGRSCCRRWG